MRLLSKVFMLLASCLMLQAGPVESFFREQARPLTSPDDLAPMIAQMADKRVVLLGEASHGTSEFYTLRDTISRRLIEAHGFNFIAVEGDWSALLHLDRYVRHMPGAPASARDALLAIDRWPLWMWANEEMVALGEWLHTFNKERPANQRVGIHGIDVYGLWDSIHAVIRFYEEHFPDEVEAVRARYSLLLQFEGNNNGYVRHLFNLLPSARADVEYMAHKLARRHGTAQGAMRDRLFKAKQHAKVVRSAEQHLRYNIMSGPHSWNARARHFAEATLRLLDASGENSRGIVWAHNTHVGDARATSMAQTGEVNIGQLMRQHFGPENVFILGFGTGTGSVLAGSSWGGAVQTMAIPQPPPGSLEGLLLGWVEQDSFWSWPAAAIQVPRIQVPHRAIGVIYDPSRENPGNFVPSRLDQRYDAFIFLRHTQPLRPLHPAGS